MYMFVHPFSLSSIVNFLSTNIIGFFDAGILYLYRKCFLIK